MDNDRLESEVKFLEDFGKRFKSKKIYLAAIGDLLHEGLITRKAYNIICERKSKQIQENPPQKRSQADVYKPSGESDGCMPRSNRGLCNSGRTIRSTCDSKSSRC